MPFDAAGHKLPSTTPDPAVFAYAPDWRHRLTHLIRRSDSGPPYWALCSARLQVARVEAQDTPPSGLNVCAKCRWLCHHEQRRHA